MTREKVKSVRRGGRALQLLEPPDPANSSYQQIQRMEERIQSIENLAKRSLIAREQAAAAEERDQQEPEEA